MNATHSTILPLPRQHASVADLTCVHSLEPHTVQLKPRFEGSNINTWIGFKHVMYLLEEALLETMRINGLAPRVIFEQHGLCFEIVDSDARILTALHQDDLVQITIMPSASSAESPEVSFKVTAQVERDGKDVKAVAATMRALWRLDRSILEAPAMSKFLRYKTHSSIDRGVAVPITAPGAFGLDPSVARNSGLIDPITAMLAPPGSNSFVWKWHVPYFYCHFNDRIQHSGYLRLMEEVVDLFLHARGISIRTMMDTRGWIPVVPHANVSILAEAEMEETIYTVYTVEEIFKRTTYNSRMDCYVLRGGRLIHTATGHITHGYARIHDRCTWSLVEFDEPTISALSQLN